MKFNTIKKEILIHATKQKVWHVLFHETFTNIWYQEFSKGAYAKTDWNIGSKAVFGDPTGNGLTGKITENRKFEAMTIEFTGQLIDGSEDYTSKAAQEIKGKRETYRIAERNGPILLSISADMGEPFMEQMEPAWERALLKIKNLAEGKSLAKPKRKIKTRYIILTVVTIIILILLTAWFIKR